jgi:hypothetical protein
MPPLLTTLIIVGGLNLTVLILVTVLFKYLHSQAMAEGSGTGLNKWQAGGALAGFIILMGVELYAIAYFSPKGIESHPSYQAIHNFYDAIQGKNYGSAWSLISPEMQTRRWKGSLDKFKSGYENTKAVDLLAIEFVSEPSPYVDQYVVYYQDETDSPVISGLDNLGEWPLRKLPDLNNRVNELRKQMQDQGLNVVALDEMKLANLITAIRGDILRWRIENTNGVGSADALFPTTKSVSRLVGQRIVVGLHGKEWLLDQVDNIPYNEEK